MHFLSCKMTITPIFFGSCWFLLFFFESNHQSRENTFLEFDNLCAALEDESLHDRQSSARADRSQWGGKLALSAVVHVLDNREGLDEPQQQQPR